MKNIILFYSLGLLLISSCTNSKTETGDDTTSGSNKKVNTELTENFYKRLEGTIAGKQVIMHLQKFNGDYNGDYYYDGSWLNLSTDTLIGKDSVVLFENSFYDYYFNEDAKQAKISLKWTGIGFKGIWESGDKTKKYPVLLDEKYPEGSYTFSTGVYQDSVKAFTDKPKSPVAEISFEYLQSKTNNESGKWLDNQLKRISGINLGSLDRAMAFRKIADAYFADYKKEIAEQQKNGPDRGFLEWMNYTSNSQQSLAYNDNGLVVVNFLADAYTGGAHGNYSSTLYCLDVMNKKQMVLSDVVKINSNTLQTLLEKNLRKQYNIKPQDKISTVLFDNFLKPNNNFYFNDNGLAFMYNPYEVASYAQGQIVVFIPFTELKPYLVPGFASRIGIK
ncbi:RsiV family protein [Pedobacter rhodius]|uniref:RsiV family protein n=1 Tax=Pedobacter rhodius TaxID=3004098 RepID=A0ABT4KU03_9SPHI|nr:RsiV family protein [Pedobacter sp. SJ11]MCZ4222426.1 RsiV family protein [Pedobacter sp. SJ11]